MTGITIVISLIITLKSIFSEQKNKITIQAIKTSFNSLNSKVDFKLSNLNFPL